MEDSIGCRCVSGRITVLTGPMCSGKTCALVRKLMRAQIAGLSVFIFKPNKGREPDKEEIISRSGTKMRAFTLQNGDALEVLDVLDHEKNRCAIGFDEAQWIKNLKIVALELASRGNLVYIAGLDMDYRGEPYLEMCLTMGIAERVEKLTAVSVKCGCPATHTTRLRDGDDEGGTWEPRCRLRWQEEK